MSGGGIRDVWLEGKGKQMSSVVKVDAAVEDGGPS